MIAVQEHDFPCVFITGLKIGLVVKLVRIGDAGREVRRYQEGKWNGCGEQASSDARGVFGTGHGDEEFRVGRWVCVVCERMNVDGVGRETPCLYLLSDLLCVERGEYTDFAGFFVEIR